MPITENIERKVQQWLDAKVIEPETAARIRSFENAAEGGGLRWQVLLAVAFGAIMVGAGVLLFVAAHWDHLSPAQRFALVVLLVAGFHVAAGALMPKLHALGMALHGVGTVALGAGIFLAGQIFNLEEHWPGGILLWAVGAVLAWLVLRDWVQATLALLLVPAWIASEWAVRAEHYKGAGVYLVQFLFLLTVAYLGARGGGEASPTRRAMTVIGCLALLPLGVLLPFISRSDSWPFKLSIPPAAQVLGIVLAYVLPLGLAWLLRGRAALWAAGFAAWAAVVCRLNVDTYGSNLALYALYALASVALVLWGVREQRRERINLGVAAFAITITCFYFSTMMDKLGRSASLVAFGLLFLLGGWKLEQLRRRLVAHTKAGVA